MAVTPMTPVQFYGQARLRGRRPGRRTSQSDGREMGRSAQTHRLPTAFPHRILGPTNCWKIFYRQSEAFLWARTIAEDVQVFAFEAADVDKDKCGIRRYLVTSLPVFWHYYSQLEASQRHHYEILAEGCPCKLYFDLEFLTDVNPGRNGERMVDILIQYACGWLHHTYNIRCDRRHVLDLDASTSSKFSRHLIFQLDQTVFESCVQAGNFVRHIFSLLVTYIKRQSETRVMGPGYVTDRLSDKEGVKDLTATQTGTTHSPRGERSRVSSDTGSTLLHPALILCGEDHITGDDGHIAGGEGHIAGGEGHIAEGEGRITEGEGQTSEGEGQSSINDMDAVCGQFTLADLRSLLVSDKDGHQTLFPDLGVYTKNRNFRLYLSSKLHKNNPLVVARQNQFQPVMGHHHSKEETIFYASLISYSRCPVGVIPVQFPNPADQCTSPADVHSDYNNYSRGSGRHKSGVETKDGQAGSSPYPKIDHFVKSLVTHDNCHGTIRRWTHFLSGQTLIYDIAGCRWCGRIKREHRSNNIMYVVDLQHGVYYQKCHDPDCQAVSYRSQALDLPQHLLPDLQTKTPDTDKHISSGCYDDSDDELLLATVNRLEDQAWKHMVTPGSGRWSGGCGDDVDEDDVDVDNDEMLAAAEVAEMVYTCVESDEVW